MTKDEVFTHVSNDGSVRHFDTTQLFAAVAPRKVEGCELVYFDLAEGQYKWMMEHAGIEEPRVARLCEPYLSVPGLICVLPDGADLIVDGNHRYVRRYRDGLNDMKAFRVPESVWVKFLIRMPPEMERLFVQTVRNSA